MYRLRRLRASAAPFGVDAVENMRRAEGDLRRIVRGKGRLLKNRTAAERAGIKGVFVI